MKLFIIFILSFLPYSAFSDIPSQDIPEKVRSGKKAVWKIHSLNGSGTGFFTGPKRFVTNFHVISGLLDKSSLEDISLSQEGNSRKLKIKRIIALSAFYDLATLETEQEVSDYLSLSGEAVPQQEENLYVIGYPKGSFKIMKKTSSSFYQDSQSYTINIGYFEIHGGSGSPVLNEQSQVSGVFYQGSENFPQAVKINHLRNLLEQKTGLVCDNLDPKSCIKSEIENLKKLAKQGYASAQFKLARMYDNGDRVTKNLSKAVYWFEKAALQGDTSAQFMLAEMYNFGEGVTKNPSIAAYWFEKAALQGHASSQRMLAEMYEKGKGVTKNPSMAAYWFEKAALQGDTLARFRLADMHYNIKDFSKAAYWFEKAALQDHAYSQYILAEMYEKGKGVTKSPSMAAYWFEKAADSFEKAALQGTVGAQFMLASMYYYGGGVKKDPSKAAYWFEKAALQGHTEAQSHLAKMRSNGLLQKTAQDDSLDPCQSAMKK